MSISDVDIVSAINEQLRRDPPPEEVLVRIVGVLQRARGLEVPEQRRGRRAAAAASAAIELPGRRPVADEQRWHGNSLPIGDAAAERRARAHPSATFFERLPARQAAAPPAEPPRNERAELTRRLQALMEGSDGKYQHADALDDGSTQIGGLRTKSRSMVADLTAPGVLSGVASRMAAGKPPYIQNGPEDFRF